MEEDADEDVKSPIFDEAFLVNLPKQDFKYSHRIFPPIFLAYPKHCLLKCFKAFFSFFSPKMREEQSSRPERSSSCLQVRASETFLPMNPCVSELLQCRIWQHNRLFSN